jgi:putative DNA primase/helicase
MPAPKAAARRHPRVSCFSLWLSRAPVPVRTLRLRTAEGGTMNIQDLLCKLKCVKRSGAGWTARCPAHDDLRNSLSIAEAASGRILLFCHAGCPVERVCARLNIELKDLMPASATRSPEPRIVKVYDYRDESGTLLYQNCRFEPKDFRQRKPDGNDGFVWKLNGVRRVPYRLTELMESELEVVFLAEGEKDADSLAALGLLTSNFKNWRHEFNQFIARFPSVVLLRDHDKSGAKQAADAAQIIEGSVPELKIVDLYAGEPLPEKGGKDVSDWIEAGGTAEDLFKLVTAASPLRAAKTKADKSSLTVVRMADVEPVIVHWLWYPYIALGKFTILEGDPGLGKSWLTCAIAASVSLGRGLPGAEPFEPGDVLMLSAEDGLGDTLRPRLNAVEADVTRVFALNVPLTFNAEGLSNLEAAVVEYNPKLVVIDPLFAYTGGKTDIHRANECRAISAPLAAIAERSDCAIVAVRHLGKSRGGGHALNAGIGSIDFAAAARSVLLVGQDPDDHSKRALVQTKNNLAPIGEGIGYTLEGGRFYWTGATKLTAQRILSLPSNEEERGARFDAVEFLRSALADGSRASKEVESEARNAGISESTLRRAKRILGIRAVKEGGHFGGGQQQWLLVMPESVHPFNEGSQTDESERLQANDASNNVYGSNLAEDAHSLNLEFLQPPDESPDAV